MDYTNSMRKAAIRHFEAAENLIVTNRKDVAGYLYGLAAECAIKEIMLRSGMRPLPVQQKRDDPFFAHFEMLKSLLRDTAAGRLGTELRRIAESSAFMQYWDTSMRYSDGRELREQWIEKWREDAQRAIAMMDD